jgi:hypothetical protein
VADPQLRCLLCDLVLAEETTPPEQKEKCRQCGRDMLRGQRADEPVVLEQLKPPPLPVEDVPVAKVVPARRTTTAADVPYARPSRATTPMQRRTVPNPERARTDPQPASRPQVVKALGVLGCVVILGILCVSIIAYAVVVGLQKARPKTAQVTVNATAVLIQFS